MELKPCPFCGEKAILRIDSIYLYYIECTNLACIARDTRWFKSEKEAIEAWNKRYLPQPNEQAMTYRDIMDKTITELKALFDSIVCLAVEGPEVTTKLTLMKAIEKEAMKGYDLCKKLLSQPPKQDKPYAKRVGYQEIIKNAVNIPTPLFEVIGGSHNGSTVTSQKLEELGIEIKDNSYNSKEATYDTNQK